MKTFQSYFAIAATSIVLLLIPISQAQAACNDATPEPIEQVHLPGHVFTPIPSKDGCWVFVSVTQQPDPGSSAGVAVLRRDSGKMNLLRVAAIKDGHPTGMVLSHDGSLLIVADQDDVVFFDVEKLTSNHPQPLLGRINVGKGAGAIFVNVTSDDRFLFVSDEADANAEPAITVINLEKARGASGFGQDSIVGKIPTGRAPVGLVFSPDQRFLYATNEVSPTNSGWPIKCRIEGSHSPAEPRNPEGALLVIDVKRAEADPSHAVLATVPSGCSPVRLQISPTGDRIYTTVRAENALFVFDTARLTGDPLHAQIARVSVGAAPVGIEVIEDGTRIVTANSNRVLGPQAAQELTVVDASRILEGSSAVIGAIPAGAFPRELRTSFDGQTLFLTNFNSNTLEVIDLRRLSALIVARKK